MQMPAHAYELLPLAVLIGGLIALSQLASGSELTVMKSQRHEHQKTDCRFAAIRPDLRRGHRPFGRMARTGHEPACRKSQSQRHQRQNQHRQPGLWLKEGNHIINVREMLPDHTLLDVKV